MSATNENVRDDDSNEFSQHNNESALCIEYFLNSEEFMLHFKDLFFQHYLAETLGFSEYSLSTAVILPGIICCDELDPNDNHCNYEVIPSILIPWPDKLDWPYKSEWPLRQNAPAVTVRNGCTETSYWWPTDDMINKVKGFNAVIIPRGFTPRRGTNICKSIEWELAFPNAEQYLELRMSHAQMRIYLFLIILFKTFIEPVTKGHGLVVEHIRHLMLSECESNYILWPEDQLGTKLKMVLKKLCKHLGYEHLPNYFVRERNTFKNVPGCYLRYAQTVIHEIIEAPALFVLYALKHLKYSKEEWYPVPDLDELYHIIIADSGTEKRGNNKKNFKKQSGVDVDVQKPLKEFDLIQSEPLLRFFIKHFIKIAEHSYKQGLSVDESSFYLKQTYYLVKLMEQCDKEGAAAFHEQIKTCNEEICLLKENNKASTSKRAFGQSLRKSGALHEKLKTTNKRNLNEQPCSSEVKRKINAKHLRLHNSMESLTLPKVLSIDSFDEPGKRRLTKSVSFKT